MNVHTKLGRLKKIPHCKSAVGCRVLDLVYIHRYAAYDIRRPICDGKIFPTVSIFCKHTSKFTCHLIFSLAERKNHCGKLDIGCSKSESDTCKQPNINEKNGKIRYRKSAVGCCKPHTCVCTVSTLNRLKNDHIFKFYLSLT